MQTELPPIEGYPKSHRVVYLYYSGVLHFIDGDYETANKDLTEAMGLCKPTFTKNIEAILLYLIPIRMLLFRETPSQSLWESYPRLEAAYRDLAAAAKAGNVRAFDAGVEMRRTLFVQRYLYLAVETLRVACVRNLVRRSWMILGKSTRLPVADVARAFTLAGFWTDDDLFIGDDDKSNLDEIHLNRVESIVANFIASNQIKGYISHERRIIVLSNKDPFPKISRQEP